MESLVNYLFLAVTGFVAFHGLTYRDEDGKRDFVRLFFGAIALLFFLRTIFIDILELPVF